MRHAETASLHGFLTQLQRAAGEVTFALLTRHETMANFTSPVPLDGPRWQSVAMLATSVMLLLVVEVWFFYSKSRNCCIEIRALLDNGSGLCPPTLFDAPCLGFSGARPSPRAGAPPRPTTCPAAKHCAPPPFWSVLPSPMRSSLTLNPARARTDSGNCADLAAQFSEVQGALPDGYACHQFPDEESQADLVIAALIACAVAIPFTYLIGEARRRRSPAPARQRGPLHLTQSAASPCLPRSCSKRAPVPSTPPSSSPGLA